LEKLLVALEFVPDVGLQNAVVEHQDYIGFELLDGIDHALENTGFLGVIGGVRTEAVYEHPTAEHLGEGGTDVGSVWLLTHLRVSGSVIYALAWLLVQHALLLESVDVRLDSREAGVGEFIDLGVEEVRSDDVVLLLPTGSMEVRD
jgi:hypothetical protein